MQEPFRHHQIHVDGLSIHLAEAGSSSEPALVFLHGWPESWETFREVMVELCASAHVLALEWR